MHALRLIPALLLYLIGASFAQADEAASALRLDLGQGVVVADVRPFTGGRLTYCDEHWACLIDGKPFWGSDGGVPKYELKALTLELGGTALALDVSGMFDPFPGGTLEGRFELEREGPKSWVLHGSFSDGAGGYHAQWLIRQGGAMRVLIGNGERLYEDFKRLFPDS